MKKEDVLKEVEKTQFGVDLKQPLAINGGEASKGLYNLVVSIRDCKLKSKGITPHRHWQLNQVKRYFGVTGTVQKILEKLEVYKEALLVK